MEVWLCDGDLGFGVMGVGSGGLREKERMNGEEDNDGGLRWQWGTAATGGVVSQWGLGVVALGGMVGGWGREECGKRWGLWIW
ncbi:uncharacterized protein G2W53_008093 [Senna tora]|uniref:Uncharacterized protein n=1 Tax=Senna tora TaxID=362788 RepID=A0A835CFI2_9FABA|nr:uncharacterized protein G2W53_008093 [Senna tora]